MSEKGGFSFSSVITSYFMVAGGIMVGILTLIVLALKAPDLVQKNGEVMLYGLFAVGGFVGAFFAARASKGETVLEPAIGAVLVVATFVGMSLAMEGGVAMFKSLGATATKNVAIAGGLAAAGAILGAFVSEKMFGEATTSRYPWILYIALSVLGACFMCMLVGSVLFSRTGGSEDSKGLLTLIGVAAGCLIAGLAAGASSRTRILAPAFVGAIAGAFGFVMLFAATFTIASGRPIPSDAYTVAAIFAAGGGIVTLAGTAVGWAAIGKKNAG